MKFIQWTEIESAHNIKKYAKTNPDILNNNKTVIYKYKIKLHGTNAAIQIHEDGKIIPQSRTQLLIDGADNCGFAKFVKDNEDLFKKSKAGYVYYGEWIGPGIQKNVACSNINTKVFAIFAARPLSDSDELIIEPAILEKMIGTIKDVYVLPWGEHKDINNIFKISWEDNNIIYNLLEKDASSLEGFRINEIFSSNFDLINKIVSDIEDNDYWVEKTFNVKGTGEGVVFYPVSNEHLGHANFCNLVFKAKGEKHKNIKTSAPAQFNPEMAKNIESFIDLVLTSARLEQGASIINTNGFEMKNIGKFINWISSDVEKETKAELEASNLTFKSIQKALSDKARAWYIEECNK